MSVGDIDGVNQEFKAWFYIGAKWKEPALKGKTQEVSLHTPINEYS